MREILDNGYKLHYVNKPKYRDAAYKGGESIMDIHFKIPISIIIKFAGIDKDDILTKRTSYGWKFDYLDKTFGDYVVTTDNVDNIEEGTAKETLEGLYDLSMESARDVFLHRALLLETLNEYLKQEIDLRIRDRYYPICLESKWIYAIKDKNGKRIYFKKLRIKYLMMVLKYGLGKLLSNLLFKML